MKFLVIQLCGVCQDIHSKMKDKLLHLETYSTFGCVTLADLLSDSKAASFEQQKALQHVQLLCKLLCHLGHIIQEIQWCLKCQWQTGMLFGAFGSPYR